MVDVWTKASPGMKSACGVVRVPNRNGERGVHGKHAPPLIPGRLNLTSLHTRPDCLRILLPVVLCAVALLPAPWAQARQSVQLFDRVTEEQDYVARDWPPEVDRPETHARWTEQLLAWYHAEGWFASGVDSVSAKAVWVTVGERTIIGSVETRVMPDSLRAGPLQTELEQLERALEGAPAASSVIRAAIGSFLDEMTRSGYLAAEVEIEGLGPGEDGVLLQLGVRSGLPTRLESIRLEGDERTRPGTVYALTGLSPGQGLAALDMAAVRSRLISAGWHESVGQPRFELASDTTAIMVIPATPRSPGQFDVMMGSLPDADGGRNRWVGSGHLLLRNAFGAGRTAEARVNRLPGQAASGLLSFETPAPRDWPIVMAARFEGYQQDSTFSRTSLGGSALFRLDPTSGIGATFSWDRTRAGQGGSQVQNGLQRIPESNTRFAGITFRYRRLDDFVQPRSGVSVTTTLERGIRTIRTREVVGADTVRIRRSEPRERLSLEAMVYGLNRGAVGLAFGASGGVMRAERVDESELFELGGASSLRGYDEDRFRGTSVGRVFAELRWYFDARSRAFLFYDAGWVGLSEKHELSLPEGLRNTTGYHPGYGLGFVFSSAVGPVTLSYALNPEASPSDGRVHLALSFDL